MKNKTAVSMMLAVLTVLFCLSACDVDIDIHIPDPPPDKATLPMTVAECEPPLPASVESDHFYAYDAEGNLFRVFWEDTRELQEGSKVYVEFDAVKHLTYEDGYPSGWTPQYEVRAKSMTLDLPFALPDFADEQIHPLYLGGVYRYYDPETSLEAVKSYVSKLEAEGFTCHRYEAPADDAYGINCYLLYRDEVTVLLEKSKNTCHLRYWVSYSPDKNAYTDEYFKAPTSEKVLKQLNDPEALYAFEITPRELHTATKGARLYEVVYKRDTYVMNAYTTFYKLTTQLVLVGEDGVHPLHSLCPDPFLYRDIDGDGAVEILYVSAGYTSGVPSDMVNILEVQDGMPRPEAEEWYHGDYSFEVLNDGSLILRRHAGFLDDHPPVDFTFEVRDGNILLTPVE